MEDNVGLSLTRLTTYRSLFYTFHQLVHFCSLSLTRITSVPSGNSQDLTIVSLSDSLLPVSLFCRKQTLAKLLRQTTSPGRLEKHVPLHKEVTFQAHELLFDTLSISCTKACRLLRNFPKSLQNYQLKIATPVDKSITQRLPCLSTT